MKAAHVWGREESGGRERGRRKKSSSSEDHDHLVASSLGGRGCWREKVVARVEEAQASVVSSVPGSWWRLNKDLVVDE